MIVSLILVAIVAQAATASPSSTSAPTTTPSPAPPQSSVLAIPASWHPATVKAGADALRRLGEWNAGDGSGESIALDVAPNFDLDLHGFVQKFSKGLTSAQSQISVLSNGPLPLCHGRAGWKQAYSDSSGGGITIVYTLTQSHAYVVTYTYPGYPGPSAQGEAAAESLCPATDPIVRLPPPPLDVPAQWKAIDPSAYGVSNPGMTYWLWAAPSERGGQRLTLLKFPLPPGHGGLSYGLTAMVAKLARGNATVIQRGAISLCHGTDGAYVVMRATSPGASPMALESVMTIVAKQAYAAVYTRHASEQPDPQAEHALRSLCPSGPSRSL